MITPRYLILLLTHDCNLNCAYCYRGANNTAQAMSVAMIEAVIRMMISSEKQCHVQLTGGEPTLVPHLIEHAAKILRNLRPAATLGIQTNGTLLNRSMAQMFKKYGIQVGVSLDGPMDIQQQLRGSAASTLKGLKLLEAEGVTFRVTTVLSRQNIDHLNKLVLMLGAFPNACGLGLDLLIQKGLARESDLVFPPEPHQMESGLNRMMDALRLVNQRRFGQLQIRELETVANAFAGKQHPYFCHAGTGESLAVCQDGSLFPCGQTAGDPRFFMGTIDTPDTFRSLPLKNFRLSHKDCIECPLYQRCPGDCHSRQYYNDEKTRRLACVMYQSLCKQFSGCESYSAKNKFPMSAR